MHILLTLLYLLTYLLAIFTTRSARVVLFAALSVCDFADLSVFFCFSVNTMTWTVRSRYHYEIFRASSYIGRRCLQVRTWLYSVSQKNPPWGFVAIFPKRLRIFRPNFMCILCVPITLGYELLFNYLQLWRSYAILSVTTQFTSCVQNVHHQPKRTLAFSDIFPKQLGIFSPHFTRLLNVHIYARVQIFIQLSPTVTKLCHIKCDHPACVSVDDGRLEHIMVVALNMA